MVRPVFIYVRRKENSLIKHVRSRHLEARSKSRIDISAVGRRSRRRALGGGRENLNVGVSYDILARPQLDINLAVRIGPSRDFLKTVEANVVIENLLRRGRGAPALTTVGRRDGPKKVR